MNIFVYLKSYEGYYKCYHFGKKHTSSRGQLSTNYNYNIIIILIGDHWYFNFIDNDTIFILSAGIGYQYTILHFFYIGINMPESSTNVL